MEILQGSGLEIVMVDEKFVQTEQALIKAINGCTAVIAGDEAYGPKVFDAVPTLKIIVRCSPGTEGIALDYARSKGVEIATPQRAHVQSVAEFVVGGLLMLMRHYAEMNEDVRTGAWRPVTGRLLAGQQVGIVGLGRVGTAVAELFLAFGCKVSFHDPHLESTHTLSSGRHLYNVPLDELAAWSNILTLHCPYNENEGPVLTDGRLRLMPQGAIVINTASARLIDEASLYSAINTRHLAGAVIDVVAEEPYTGPLLELDRVLITPQAASSTAEARLQMEEEAVQALFTTLGIAWPDQ